MGKGNFQGRDTGKPSSKKTLPKGKKKGLSPASKKLAEKIKENRRKRKEAGIPIKAKTTKRKKK